MSPGHSWLRRQGFRERPALPGFEVLLNQAMRDHANAANERNAARAVGGGSDEMLP
jgi:hypothetical protein